MNLGSRTIVALVLWVGGSAPALCGPVFTDRYDADIEKAAKRWLPGWDWHWWKAQLYQESRLNPAAVSPAGARGLAQFMPGTWREVAPGLGYGALSPHSAEVAIMAGAFYMSRQRSVWRSERPEADRRELAQASYNAGAGNIMKAQRLCEGARHWPQIRTCLPRVTGKHAAETTTYIDRIRRWYWMMRS